MALGSSRRSRVYEEFKIPIAAHSGSSQQIFDNKHWNGVVVRDHKWTLHANFDIDVVVSFLSIKTESILLEHPDEALKVDWPKGGHELFNAQAEVVHRHELRGAPCNPLPLIAGFLKDLVESTYCGARNEKPVHRVADVPPSFVYGRTAAREVQRWHIGDEGFTLFEDVCVEGKIVHLIPQF